ncbi:MAG: ABC transporter ATP-binding protein, partial [Proteobacteria bacterium]|nr:ABC transporter ATP-binding protein [Pseudomonadota bacterium]
AGKTTTLRAICGLLQVASGSRITYAGQDITGIPTHRLADLGITLVPEGRQLFPKMTVEENLILGSYLKRAKTKRGRNLGRVYELFPRLAERRGQLAETLSGGEQQMVAVGRGLMQDPEVIMFDEPSLGLAPILVSEIFRVVQELNRQGLTVFLVEQNVHHCLKIADYCYVIENGRVVQHGSGQDLEADPRVREAYLGF